MWTIRLGPVNIHLHGNTTWNRVGADEAPTATEDVELSVGDLRRVTEQHGYSHSDTLPAAPPHAWPPRHSPILALRLYPDVVAELELRNDVYRRPLSTALERLGLGAGWRCVDVGAGAGDVSVALAALVGRDGRIYAVDSDPRARDVVAAAAAAAGEAQVIAITQSAEDLRLPEMVDLAFCRFLLMHVEDPSVVLRRMASVVRPGGFVVAQEPITTAGRVGGLAMSMPDARHQDIGATLAGIVRDAGLELVDAWAEAPAGAGAGPGATYLEELTDVDPGDDPVVLPPLVTVIARKPQ